MTTPTKTAIAAEFNRVLHTDNASVTARRDGTFTVWADATTYHSVSTPDSDRLVFESDTEAAVVLDRAWQIDRWVIVPGSGRAD